jgi:hypothetical protein
MVPGKLRLWHLNYKNINALGCCGILLIAPPPLFHVKVLDIKANTYVTEAVNVIGI